jgi:hypothetical protein
VKSALFPFRKMNMITKKARSKVKTTQMKQIQKKIMPMKTKHLTKKIMRKNMVRRIMRKAMTTMLEKYPMASH